MTGEFTAKTLELISSAEDKWPRADPVVRLLVCLLQEVTELNRRLEYHIQATQERTR